MDQEEKGKQNIPWKWAVRNKCREVKQHGGILITVCCDWNRCTQIIVEKDNTGLEHWSNILGITKLEKTVIAQVSNKGLNFVKELEMKKGTTLTINIKST